MNFFRIFLNINIINNILTNVHNIFDNVDENEIPFYITNTIIAFNEDINNKNNIHHKNNMNDINNINDIN